MIHLKPQSLLDSFAFVTLLLAGTAIGRLLGAGFDEALYLSALTLIAIGWTVNRFLLRRRPPPISKTEPEG